MKETRSSAADLQHPDRSGMETEAAEPGKAAEASRAGDEGASGRELAGEGARVVQGEQAGAPEPAEASGDGGTASGGEDASAPEGGDAASGEAEKYKREAEETYQRLLRLQADYENFRRRTRLEKEELAKYASRQLVEKLLPVLDNFERALAAARSTADFDSFARGVDMIYRQLTDVLAQEGLEPIKAVGEPFDPALHQAVMRVESEEHGDNIVVEELQKGYRLKEKVIRPSMVKVNAKP